MPSLCRMVEALMPILPDTLGSKAFFRTAKRLKVPMGPHKGEPVLDIVGAARQDSGSLEAFARLARDFGFAGGLMASAARRRCEELDGGAGRDSQRRDACNMC
eukprot:g22995.t1